MITMVLVRWRTKRSTSSIVTTAHALATKKNTQVAYAHMQQAFKAERFICEFNSINTIENILY